MPDVPQAGASPRAPTPVGHLVTALNTGGTERQLLDLLRQLPSERWRPRVVCFRKIGHVLPELQALGIDPLEVSLGGTLVRAGTARVIARLVAWLRAERCALLHCHDVNAILVGVPAARLAGIPVLAARRDLGHQLSPAHRTALRLALAGATLVLANSHAVAAQAEREDRVSPSRLALVPNGLDLPRFDSSARALLGPPPFDGRRPVLLKVGRFVHPVKGHEDFLRAAALVRAHRPDARFVLVGDGPREPVVRALTRALGLEEHVIFAGHRVDVPALLTRATVACHAAHQEGLPNAVMEAMAAARPIVATSVGGIPDLISHAAHGLLVPPRAPDRLAASLLELLADPARAARLGAAARARIERDYSMARLVTPIDTLYSHLLTRGSR